MSGNLHILFCTLAAGSLRKALREAGRDDEVVSLPDDLSYGRIASVRPEERVKALHGEGFFALGEDGAWLAESSRRFWDRCAGSEKQPILWVSSRSGQELAGFMAYLHRFGDRACHILRLEEMENQLRETGRTFPLLGSSSLLPEDFRAVWNKIRPFAPEEMAAARRLWVELLDENALLRVPRSGRLSSAPEDTLDKYLLGAVRSSWRNVARILSEAMGAVWKAEGHDISLFFLQWRLRKLVSRRLLESGEDMSGWTVFASTSMPKIRRNSNKLSM